LPESAKVSHYKELKIWQKGMVLTKEVYRLTSKFPSEEKYGRVAQLRRAAVSVPSNITEGQARNGTREFLQFLSRASGSLAELETQLLLSVDLGHCGPSDVRSSLQQIEELQKMVAAIRRKLSVF
jgi:four helix bundle protein